MTLDAFCKMIDEPMLEVAQDLLVREEIRVR